MLLCKTGEVTLLLCIYYQVSLQGPEVGDRSWQFINHNAWTLDKPWKGKHPSNSKPRRQFKLDPTTVLIFLVSELCIIREMREGRRIVHSLCLFFIKFGKPSVVIFFRAGFSFFYFIYTFYPRLQIFEMESRTFSQYYSIPSSLRQQLRYQLPPMPQAVLQAMGGQIK